MKLDSYKVHSLPQLVKSSIIECNVGDEVLEVPSEWLLKYLYKEDKPLEEYYNNHHKDKGQFSSMLRDIESFGYPLKKKLQEYIDHLENHGKLIPIPQDMYPSFLAVYHNKANDKDIYTVASFLQQHGLMAKDLASDKNDQNQG